MLHCPTWQLFALPASPQPGPPGNAGGIILPWPPLARNNCFAGQNQDSDLDQLFWKGWCCSVAHLLINNRHEKEDFRGFWFSVVTPGVGDQLVIRTGTQQRRQESCCSTPSDYSLGMGFSGQTFSSRLLQLFFLANKFAKEGIFFFLLSLFSRGKNLPKGVCFPHPTGSWLTSQFCYAPGVYKLKIPCVQPTCHPLAPGNGTDRYSRAAAI